MTKEDVLKSALPDNTQLLQDCLAEARATLDFYKGWVSDKNGNPVPNRASAVCADLDSKLSLSTVRNGLVML